jgi:hypothetical protein
MIPRAPNDDDDVCNTYITPNNSEFHYRSRVNVGLRETDGRAKDDSFIRAQFRFSFKKIMPIAITISYTYVYNVLYIHIYVVR